MTERETITCTACSLVQFRTAKDCCRRCRVSTAPPGAKEMPMPEAPAPTWALEVLGPVLSPTSMDWNEAIAKTLIANRKRARLTQKTLALAWGVKRSYISKIEHAKLCPTIDTFCRLAPALGITMAYLIQEIECRRVLVMLRRAKAEAKRQRSCNKAAA